MRSAAIWFQLMLTMISGTLPGLCAMATGQESDSRPERKVVPGIERGRSTLSGEEPGQIWDRKILAQPFDKQPFKQIAVPEWVQETLGSGYTLSVMNSEQRAEAAAHGVTLS
ncbi:MAG TPA: hypothetical protein VLA12_06315 [Planctomycetaceae bacterium]|nr:hypothetical protein [Planctomycetaceae bacterium]